MSTSLSGFVANTVDQDVPQTERADVRQVRNDAGGFSFTVSARDRVSRFLILGTDSGTYYASPRALTQDCGNFLLDYISSGHGTELISMVREVSLSGRAPKNSPALFALAMAATFGDADVRDLAWRSLSEVARTASHLFEFCSYAKQFGNKLQGRQARRGLAHWYEDKSAHRLAVQTLKYRNRSGWSHRDVLRLAHPSVDGEADALLRWVCRPESGTENTPALVGDYLAVQNARSTEEVARLLTHNDALTWEMVPTAELAHAEVWRALLHRGMPLTAMIRNLGRMTASGVFAHHDAVTAVVSALGDIDALRRARVHPFSVLLAQNTYSRGRGVRGALSWSPIPRIVDALDGAFYAAFANVEATGKRIMLALDVSGSMEMSTIAGTHLSAREASAAMALVTMDAESRGDNGAVHTLGFCGRSTGLVPLDLTPRRRLDDNVRAISRLPFGGTDCALPMLYALNESLSIDTFVVYTDSETWEGSTHPHVALRQYRDIMGIPAQLVVVGMTATEFTIADPTDPGMLDVVGFDSASPSLISDFVGG